MGGLLDRIRRSSINDTVTGKKKKTEQSKIKRVPIKWQRYFEGEETYKIVKPKERGVCRYAEVTPTTNAKSSFRYIRKKAMKLYFLIEKVFLRLENIVFVIYFILDISFRYLYCL